MLDDSRDSEVLIVDDDLCSGSVLADILEANGYAAACSINGREALDYLRSGPRPHLIILDLEMPVMDGWQFRREQLVDNRLCEIPVIVLTGHSEPVDIPAHAVVRKPVDLERLLPLIDLLLRGASS